MTSSRHAGAILILTAHEDITTDAVIRELNRQGANVVRMDTGDFPMRSQLDATISIGGFQGLLRVEGIEVDLGTVQSIYYRRPTRFIFPDTLSDADVVLAATEARYPVRSSPMTRRLRSSSPMRWTARWCARCCRRWCSAKKVCPT